MVDFIKAYPAQVNPERLAQELKAGGFTELIMRSSECEIRNVTAPDETTIDSIIAAHDDAMLSDDQVNSASILVTQRDVKSKLFNALTTASPNVVTIYNETKTIVDGNAKLQIAVQNVMDLYALADGVPVDLLTNSGKAKYIRAVLHCVALMTG